MMSSLSISIYFKSHSSADTMYKKPKYTNHLRLLPWTAMDNSLSRYSLILNSIQCMYDWLFLVLLFFRHPISLNAQLFPGWLRKLIVLPNHNGIYLRYTILVCLTHPEFISAYLLLQTDQVRLHFRWNIMFGLLSHKFVNCYRFYIISWKYHTTV